VFLFLATCATTFYVGGLDAVAMPLRNTYWADADRTIRFICGGLLFSAPLMIILLAHEFGHYIQARRYGVPASLPYFIPVPFPPLGTMGAVIAMRGRIGDRRALYDIGITGPLAGLIPTFIFCVLGIMWSEFVPNDPIRLRHVLGIEVPLVFSWMRELLLGTPLRGEALLYHPMASAGWVGILITALNLIPIGQLDGGHVLYALLREKAHLIATMLLFGAAAAVVYYQLYHWSVMLVLLALMGPRHPPTGNDYVPLGPVRIVLGWLTLAFVIVGFTPVPFVQ
jgi:membrane-associated protease RseP (regulator of RpoE activity)